MIAKGVTEGKMSLKNKVDISRFRNFKAETLEEYINKLKGWNIVDLCAHAAKFGLAPNVERKRMEKSLIDEYKRAKAAFEVACGDFTPTTETNEDKQNRVKDILSFIRS